MNRFSRFINYITVLLVVFYSILLISNPQICKEATIKSILLCGRVIIPSFLPFIACVLFISNSNSLNGLNFLNPITLKIFKLDTENFLIFLLSFIGGYPIGAKLLSNAVENKKISAENAGKMLLYCTNAGPAFIVSAVGSEILHSQKAGVILLISHILSGVIIRFIAFPLTVSAKQNNQKPIDLNLADNFVLSVAEASKSVLSICVYVILFGGINAYILYLAKRIEFLKVISLFLEVTNGITLTKNIYMISFLLGFGGIAVWCQIMSIAKNVKFSFFKFAFFRVLQGAISVFITFTLLKIFPVTINTLSEGIKTEYFYSSFAVAISTSLMVLVFIISLQTKKYTGKLLDDMI
ncbi:MAG: hypothetical protein IJP34_01795 [Clostridia bacterium]|nr:hypothetical protein [Clostridia bacterium]